MGTRGTLGVVIDGAVKNTYNHFDSYPSGLGVEVLAQAREIAKDVDRFRALARDLRLVDENDEPTELDRKRFEQFADSKVSTGSDWYSVLRNLQGRLIEALELGIMTDAKYFPENSLWCEWGYIVDLDGATLQVYEGFQHERHNDGLWAGIPTDEDIQKDQDDLKRRFDKGELTQEQYAYFSDKKQQYHAIRLIAEWPLHSLPTEEQFLDKVTKEAS